MKTSKDIRKAFLDFFKEKNHQIVNSAPMVVRGDPTLMFTNAGMNQFKDLFLGNEPVKWSRIADTQKCLRVSGKHNDLEEVGLDTYHHTMFEMLGNWSFGDYFKEKAIDWAWEFLVVRMGINPERLYVTVFEGSSDDNLVRDNEAASFWEKYLPKERILNGSKKDNFWEMGDTGPCGPCSEVHVDLRPETEIVKIQGRDLVNKDNPLVIEIWNLVFIQFNRKANGNLEELPDKHVDTGMGFERLCMVLQGVTSNYDTDIFQNTIAEIAKLSNKNYGANPKSDIAMRVIADHLRAVSFAIADGQLPSNNKAGYVIRRILRRAVRYGYTFLGFKEAFIYKLVEVLKQTMGETFPELVSQQGLIEKVIKEEEESFLCTLSTGIRLLDNIISKAKNEQSNEIQGKDAFVLYDTYGFPLDLTELIARENGLGMDEKGFAIEMEAQKNRSRNAAAQETDDWVEISKIEQAEFLGYDKLEAEIRISRYRKVTQKKKTFYQMVFDQTPFYGESGGQVGDSGFIESNGVKTLIFDTQKENNLIVHLTEKLPDNPNETFLAVVDIDKRRATEANHSGTHLLHHALREVLGAHVEQKGSLVCPDYLRFDFSHFQKMTDEEIRQVETLVNRMIRSNEPINEHRDIPVGDALEMGAMALFGEKYGEKVRAIRFGNSIELCGGTHVKATGQIGMLKIVSEGAIAAGIRRIEAITAEKIEQHIYTLTNTMRQVREIFNNSPAFLQSIKKAVEENSELKKQLEDVMRERMTEMQHALMKDVEEHNGINVIRFRASFPPEIIKDMAFNVRNRFERMVFIAGSDHGGKPTLTIALSDALVAEGKNASNIVREAAKEMQGGGGGQPFFATAGGKDMNGLERAMEKALLFLSTY